MVIHLPFLKRLVVLIRTLKNGAIELVIRLRPK